jgi:hypothetical protein
LNRHLLATLGLIWVLCIVVCGPKKNRASLSNNSQHWVIDILRASQAFIDAPEGAVAYYSLVSNELEAAKDGVYITITLVADHFMVRTPMWWPSFV